jgi:uncharacterized protein (DUF1501 family)
MHPGHLKNLQRREFLRRAAALGVLGTASPWALTLAGIGEAAAADAPGDYRALVCVFLYGGNDHGNTLVPYDSASYTSYQTIRQTLATPRDQLASTVLTPATPLPGGRQMALAPTLATLKPIFDAGKLGVLLNIGPLIQPTSVAQYDANSVPLPPKLFSHNDQQSTWQAWDPEGATLGWGGRMGDLFLSSNTESMFTCINASGNAVFMSGQEALQYQVSPSGAIAISPIVNQSLYGSAACAQMLQTLVSQDRGHWMERLLNRTTARSIEGSALLSAALAGVPPLSTPFDSSNNLAMQLQIVAKLIAARQALGATRQVFFVSMGGFDLHDSLNSTHPGLLADIGDAMSSFYLATEELGVANSVTAFTASDFGRTLSSNGDGSDHGWGSYHFVMGGAVAGQRYYGTLPDVSVDGADDVGQGRLLPTTSVDQFAATLARWMGVSNADLPLVVPRIGNYTTTDLGLFG